jgi:mannonate dehydratase
VLRRVRAHTTTPLAIGEVFSTLWEFQQLITEQLIDHARAAVTHGGGISALRRLAALADVWQVKVSPHGPSDVSPIAMAASVHVALATPNHGIQEYMGYPGQVHEVFRHAWTCTDGHLHPGDTPGLGVEVDEALAARFPYEPALLPVARRRDGSMTDW